MIKKLNTSQAPWRSSLRSAVAAAEEEVTISTSGDGETEAKPKTKHKIAYVTNGIDPFWDLCAAGVH